MNYKNATDTRWAAGVSLIACLVFYILTKTTQHHFDYTYRIALALLRGHVGLSKAPPSWLNEFVPARGEYYSVFPLGAVLVNIPFAILRKLHLIHAWPAHLLSSCIAGGCVYFFYRLSLIREMSLPRRAILALFPVFGTWTWCNLGFGGAWQVALGFALLGETASLYFTFVRPRPLLAGAWFAIAFGNRFELLVTLPLYIYAWLSQARDTQPQLTVLFGKRLQRKWIEIGQLIAGPGLLILCTAVYNYARFGSIADFGYSRIPAVLSEPWYQHGLFSSHAVPWNMYQMLFRGMNDIPNFPYFRPDPWGCSIFIASPFLFLLFREGGKHKMLSWIAIGMLTLVLWFHGNPGGWQFSYRYAMTMLPWMFLLLVENGPAVVSASELSLFIGSIILNGLAVYEFLWTDIVRNH